MEIPVYLDYNATTPVAPEAADAMRPFLDHYFGNPSSAHKYGSKTKMAVEEARCQVAALLGCNTEEIIFTSGGTESNNYAIKGVALANRHKGNHIITSIIEHPAVIEVCRYLETNGFEVTYLPVDKLGCVNPADVEKSIRPATILISIMHANNEIGTIQPLHEISEIAHCHEILFHSDAAQSVGKVPVNVNDLGVDLLSVAGHKLYAPKGIGVLYIRNGVKLEKIIHGADHEQNHRAGTENVLEIVGLGKAAEYAFKNLSVNILHMKEMRERLYRGLSVRISDMKLNGHPENRLPNTLNVSFRGISAAALLSVLFDDVAASVGAACHSSGDGLSATLTAMQLPQDYISGTVRFSTGRFTSEEEIDYAIEKIADAIQMIRGEISVNVISSINTVKLTQFSHGLGCACKLRPEDLEKVLSQLPVPTDPNVLVGTNTCDDAAVYRITPDLALVKTLDFFTPIVDDPYHFGAIAAANALSDIYAMGAKPIFALNIVAFPTGRLPLEVLSQILKGASDKATEAGICILGGHSVEDPEPKFGMVVSGVVHPDKVLRNSNLEQGDLLVLTKPIGTGIITAAHKRQLADQNTLDAAIRSMLELNKNAAEIMHHYLVNSCTDVTGFGLLGHLHEMTVSSGMDVELWIKSIPFIPGAFDLAAAGIYPGGTKGNFEYSASFTNWDVAVSMAHQILLADAQTSGGLLISLPGKQACLMLDEMHKKNLNSACIVGRVIGEGKGLITVKNEPH